MLENPGDSETETQLDSRRVLDEKFGGGVGRPSSTMDKTTNSGGTPMSIGENSSIGQELRDVMMFYDQFSVSGAAGCVDLNGSALASPPSFSRTLDLTRYDDQFRVLGAVGCVDLNGSALASPSSVSRLQYLTRFLALGVAGGVDLNGSTLASPPVVLRQWVSVIGSLGRRASGSSSGSVEQQCSTPWSSGANFDTQIEISRDSEKFSVCFRSITGS